MRPLLLVLVLALSAGPLLFADEPQIDPSEALSHVGQTVAVSGLVVAVNSSPQRTVLQASQFAPRTASGTTRRHPPRQHNDPASTRNRVI
jgi:hypothetical protein